MSTPGTATTSIPVIWRTKEVIVQELLDKRVITAADAVVLLAGYTPFYYTNPGYTITTGTADITTTSTFSDSSLINPLRNE